jgi:uncharacterized protein involved in response to NO
MLPPNIIKTSGYLVSSVSVVLLGIVAWKSASEHPFLFACLVGGMALSILGMLLRWTSYQLDEKQKQKSD